MTGSDKETLRKTFLARRDSLSTRDIKLKSRLIKEKLFSLPEFRWADIVLFFASIRSEVSTYRMIEESLGVGKRTVLPRIAGTPRRLELFQIEDLQKDLHPGMLGILEPLPEKTRGIAPADIRLALIPGVVFDRRGYRLGYGGGYYDRLLLSFNPSALIIGLAFELQIVDALPVSPRDVPVQKIITEERVIDCRQKSSQ